MKLAYADPPYIGCANKYPENTEVNHRDLLRQLSQYDGWALSCSSSSLQQILQMDTCPQNVRIGAWVKPFCSFKPNVNPAYAWEPIIFKPARDGSRDKDTVRDWFSCNITLKKGLVGAKPLKFCLWIFDLLGAEPLDSFDDLFKGTGIVSIGWTIWCEQKRWVNLTLEAQQ